jgi:Na+/melibiose symporter-like transporter
MVVGCVLGAVLIFCPIADVGSAQIVDDLGRNASRRLFWLGIGLGVFALLEFGDGLADALGDVGEGFVFVCIFRDPFKKYDQSQF